MQWTKRNKAAYAPHIDSLLAEKMAVIVMHEMMGLVMVGHTAEKMASSSCRPRFMSGWRLSRGKLCRRNISFNLHLIVCNLMTSVHEMFQSLLEKAKGNRKKMNLVEPEVDLDKDQVMRQRCVNGLIKRKRSYEVRKKASEGRGIRTLG
ncbi:hypothetical protein NL676_009756 [Syzygium grande]|nr:hypothetical protein NL676_009756 [Syzygium grande]